MKISIDTNEDDPQHIAKAIELLKSVVGKEANSGGIFSDSANNVSFEQSCNENCEPAQPGIFNMFSDDNTTLENNKNSSTNSSRYTIKEEKREPNEPEEIPMIVEYDIE